MGLGLSIVKYYEQSKPEFEKGSVCDVAFQFLTSSLDHIAELPKCTDLGIFNIRESGGYKSSTMAVVVITKVAQEYIVDGRMFLFMGAVAKFDLPGRFLLHAENIDIILYIIDRETVKNRKDSGAWTDVRPAWCKAGKLQTYCYISKATGCPILKEDIEALWEGIRDGTIETIGSEHASWRKVDKGNDIMRSVMGVVNV